MLQVMRVEDDFFEALICMKAVIYGLCVPVGLFFDLLEELLANALDLLGLLLGDYLDGALLRVYVSLDLFKLAPHRIKLMPDQALRGLVLSLNDDSRRVPCVLELRGQTDLDVL